MTKARLATLLIPVPLAVLGILASPSVGRAQESLGARHAGAQFKEKETMASRGTPERGQVPDKYKWNTKHLYPSDEAWEKERRSVVDSFHKIDQCKGKLKQGGAAVVLGCLKADSDIEKRLQRLGNYASRRVDEDTQVAKYQGMKAVIEKVGNDYGTISSFIQPELLSLPDKALAALIADKAFADYDHFLRDLVRVKKHILSPQEEAILAATSLMRDAGQNIYSILTGAELKFPEIKDEKGKAVQLTQALFPRYRASADRKVRKAAFDVLFKTFASYKGTLGTMLSSQINANITFAKARRYGSFLEAALDAGNIPPAVYQNMLKAVNKHLPTLHRYLELRRKLLGLKQLAYYDLYPPIVQKVELKVPYDKAPVVLAEALAPLGKTYVDALSTGLKPESGWVDPYPNKGKKSGAYMDGSAYDVHPFVLGNYLDSYDSLSMLAHEMGHAMHSFFSNKTQPFPKADYSIFVAEVASTLNEALLVAHMLKTEKDPKKRLFLLGEQLESFRQTLFRQAMFAEFELALYTRAEKKEALTGDDISKIYLAIARRYYGHDKGVVTIDDAYAVEWAYVPHFYYGLYVYQYVTGITAATALSETILKEGSKARDRYVTHLLKAGNSDYPIELLKRAGVDLTTTKPYDIAMGAFERAITEAESLVSKAK
jgi:oligoendopeptidase F